MSSHRGLESYEQLCHHQSLKLQAGRLKALEQGTPAGFPLWWVTPEAAWRMAMRTGSQEAGKDNSRKTDAVRNRRNDEDLKLRMIAGIQRKTTYLRNI